MAVGSGAQAWWPAEGWTAILVHNYSGRCTREHANVETEKLRYSNPMHRMGDDDDNDEGEALAVEEPDHHHNEHENARHGRPENLIEGNLGAQPFAKTATTLQHDLE